MRISLFLKDSRTAVTSITRNTSCNTGWLPLVVHIIFGTLIVASFILIMLMTIGGGSRRSRHSTRCNVKHCTVTCTEAPYNGQFEDDIANAVSETKSTCKSIALLLNKPTFRNSLMPQNFLSRLRYNIQELVINGGNLEDITPHAFMSPFCNDLQSLVFENVKITTWKDNTLVGLSNLKRLVIRNTSIIDIKINALQAVDDTLEILNIKTNQFWNPINVTGSANPIRLQIVNFSHNVFYNALNIESFAMLKYCKILYLNSCKITFLGPGTFDFLESLELLYLNNNYLVTIPSGLFNEIASHPIRIALHDNFWFCDCSRNDLILLYRQDILLIDLICYYPDEMSGITLGEFADSCNANSQAYQKKNLSNLSNTLQTVGCKFIPEVLQINEACHNKNNSTKSILPQTVSTSMYVCSSNRISSDILKQINDIDEVNTGKKDWLTPVFSIKNGKYRMIKICIRRFNGSGLLWYQSSCKSKVYCMNTIPEIIKLYSVTINLDYTFCPYNVSSGIIDTLNCVSYSLEDFENEYLVWYQARKYILLTCGSIACFVFSASCVYAIIHRNPTLLKGNKRVLVVKHKSFDAVILPPKIPTRNILKDANTEELNINSIFTLSQSKDGLSPQVFSRSMSIRSNESNDASYVSALQPTYEQLLKWRCDQNINNQISAQSVSSLSSIDTSIPYYSLGSEGKFDNNETI